MGALIRFLFLGMVFAFGLCVFMGRTTGDPVWRQRGMNLLRWGVVIGLLAFGGVVLRRAAVFI